MSMPAVISVTGCSTCSARVHLDEVERAVLEQELEGADAAVADLPAGLGAALADLGDQRRRRCRARAPPPAPSGGGAAASSRGCRARARCRGCRPAPGSRRGADGAGTSRCRPRGCRRRGAPPRGSARARRAGRASSLHDPHAAPAAAARRLEDHRIADLARRSPRTAVGVVGQRAVGPGHAGHAGRRIARLAATLSPMVRMQAALGPMKVSPASSTRSAKPAFSDRKP